MQKNSVEHDQMPRCVAPDSGPDCLLASLLWDLG